MQETTPTDARRRRWRRLRFAAAALVLLVGVVYAGLYSLTGRPLTLPVWVTEQAESRLNAALEGTSVSLGGVELLVEAGTLPRLVMRNVGIYDARGVELARLNELGARLDRARLFSGEVQPRRLNLSGAQITLRRRADGTFDVSFGGDLETSGTLAGVLDSIDRAFASEPLSAVERISADQLTIAIEDARSGRVWQVTGGELTLDHGPDRLDLSVAAEVFNGTEEMASAVIGFYKAKGSAEATLTASFENAAAADIAAQTPALAFLEVLDAPISGAIRASMTAGGAVEELAGTLEIGEGALQPAPGAQRVRFGGARAYFDYDPARDRISFDELSLESDAVTVAASGHAYLREHRNGWPGALVGQFRTSMLRVAPAGVFEEPVAFDAGAADFRLRLDPFTVDIGQIALGKDGRRIVGQGSVTADPEGWSVAMDVSVDELEHQRLLALWPVRFAKGARDWLTENTRAGMLYDIEGAIRTAPGQPPRLSVSYKFRDADVRYMRTLPPVKGGSGYASILNNAYTMVLEKGEVTAPDGGKVFLGGTVMQIPDVTQKPSRALFSLKAAGPIPSALSLLDRPPFRLMQRAGRAPDVATGTATLDAALAFDLRKRLKVDDVDFSVTGDLTGVRSETLVRNRVLTADALRLRADRDGIEIAGPVKLGAAQMDAAWIRSFDPDAAGRSRVEGTVTLDRAFLEEFRIGLPPGSLSGSGVGQFEMTLEQDAPPTYRIVSDLNRLTLRLDALGWSKPANRTGRLEVAGRLGDDAEIETVAFEAAGLRAEGRISIAEGGGLGTARFDRVRAGGWLDAPVVLEGRGEGVPPLIRIPGGRLDVRRATLGGGGGGGASAPLEVALDRLVLSDTLALTDFRGRFATAAGLDGPFTARVNGRTPISGRVIPQSGKSAFRVTGEDAGGALGDAGVLRNLRGGRMDLVLQPTGPRGTYDGRLDISGARLVEAPALTALLSAISVVGLLEQLAAEGIALETVQANFRLSPEMLTLYDASAMGPSMGFSLDGRFDMRTKRMDMQGVVSPLYFLNGIGQLFTRRGEGLFGFNFRMTGAADNPRVSVNPLSILTPGMFREIFRRPPPVRVIPAPEVGQ